MKRRKIIIGICAVCALVLSAIVAQGAMAQTAFTCGEGLGSKDFSDAHCKVPVTAGTGKFGHATIAPNTNTKVTITNITTGTERSIFRLKSVQNAVTLELQATEVEGTGTMENKEEGGVMLATMEVGLTLKGVTVTAPAGKGCAVVGGKIELGPIHATTEGLTNEISFASIPEILSKFTIASCSVTALNHVYMAKGVFNGKTEGATVIFTHAGTTGQNAFSLSGQNLGAEGSLTIKGENGNGLALT